jgi:hypothetical protein
LKVNFEVEGNSLRSNRSRLRLLDDAAGPGDADV